MHEIQWDAPAHDGIREHTRDSSNERIDQATLAALEAAASSDVSLRDRLMQLDREWDVDRALMLNFAVLGGLSGSLAMRSLVRSGRLGGWGALFFTQIGFLAYHAVRRWCPPLPVFRRLGYRSSHEIAAERTAIERALVTG